MFPTQNHFHPRNRRRGRNDPNNRDYICPCGKSYLSYPALFTHIKTKHNSRAPGQIIKPTSQNSRRGRPKQREVYDSESDTEDISNNSLDRLCDYVMATQPEKGEEVSRLKEIYMKDPFYQIYTSFNQQDQQPKYNENDDIYEQNCDNVFSQFMAQINKRVNEPFYIDLLFVFVVMVARTINKARGNRNAIKDEPVQNISDFVNDLLLKELPDFRAKYELGEFVIFGDLQMAKLIELFFGWLTQKKYLAVKVKINDRYFSNSSGANANPDAGANNEKNGAISEEHGQMQSESHLNLEENQQNQYAADNDFQL